MEITEVDVLVIGAGPSGLAAAIELRSLGVQRVLVVDREPVPGGVPRHCDHIGFGMRDLRRVMSGPGYARRYAAAAERSGVEIRTGVTVTDWLGDRRVRVTSSMGIRTIEARAIVLATGCRERARAARLVPGSRPEGVFTTGSLQRFVHDFNHPIGERAVVVGAEHVSYSAAHTLRLAGLCVAAMVTDQSRHQSFWPYIRIAKGFDSFPLYTNCRITEIQGKGRVQAIAITSLTTGETRRIPCDTVVFTGDWIPEQELARKAGLQLDAGTRGPAVDGLLRSSLAGVFAVGNLVHPGETADTAALSGRAAARHVTDFLERGIWRTGARIGFEFDSELVQWMHPNVLEPGENGLPSGHFILRVARVLESPTLAIRQGDQLLWRRRFHRLVPNLPTSIPGSFLERLDPEGGAVRVVLVGDGHSPR